VTIWRAISKGEFPEILAQARLLERWDSEVVEKLNASIIGWCERAMSIPLGAKSDNAAALYDLVGRLRVISGDDALDAARPNTSIEWRTLESLLNERLSRLARGVSMADNLRGRQHVDAILCILAGKETVPQFMLSNTLGISDSTLSQVLSRMENAQLIIRERDATDGRTKLVRLSDEERARSAPGAPSTASGYTQRPLHGGIALAFPRANAA